MQVDPVLNVAYVGTAYSINVARENNNNHNNNKVRQRGVEGRRHKKDRVQQLFESNFLGVGTTMGTGYPTATGYASGDSEMFSLKE